MNQIATQSDLENLENQEYVIGQPRGIIVEEIIALKTANPNLTTRQAARILGCSQANIYDHLSRNNLTWTGIARELETFKSNKSNVLHYKQKKMLEQITPKKMESASVRDLCVAFGILYEKQRLEDGESTQNHSVLSARLDAAKRRLKTIDAEVGTEDE